MNGFIMRSNHIRAKRISAFGTVAIMLAMAGCFIRRTARSKKNAGC